MAARLPVWLPTIIAAWRTGASAIALSTALRAELREDGPLSWPDELTAEFMLTLGELFDSFPALEEALPTAADLMELGVQATEDKRAQKFVMEAIGVLESTAQRLLGRLFDLAFLTPPTKDSGSRASHLLRLFNRLEELLDRLLQILINQAGSKGNQL